MTHTHYLDISEGTSTLCYYFVHVYVRKKCNAYRVYAINLLKFVIIIAS
jgi:hypothetical protein